MVQLRSQERFLLPTVDPCAEAAINFVIIENEYDVSYGFNVDDGLGIVDGLGRFYGAV